MKGDPRSHGLWERTAPPPPETGPLAGERRVAVAIIGGGYTGLSAALHLAEAGTSVCVLEGVAVGFGGSGRNVGLVNAGLWVMPDDVAASLPAPYGERLLAELGAGPDLVFDLVARHGIACEAVRTGTLHCAVGPTGAAEIAGRAAQWQGRGAPVELLGRAEAAAATGSPAYAGALLDRRAGTVQPLAYARGLARAAIAAGAALFTGSPVRAIERAGEGWRLALDGGAVTAEKVVVATNAYTDGILPAIRAELVALRYFNIATAPLPPEILATVLPGRQGAWDTRAVLSSFRLDAAGRLVVGSVGALRGTGTAIHRAWARRALRAVFPQAAEAPFEAEWYGTIGMTSDSLPRLHRFGPGLVGLSGYNGRGIAPGTVFGRALADLCLGRRAEADLPLPVTEPDRPAFRRVREAWYEAGAQAAHLVAGWAPPTAR